LHERHRRIVLAADGVDPCLVAGLAVYADRFGHRDLALADAGNRGRVRRGNAAAMVGRPLAAQPIAMEAGEEPRRDRSVALAERTYIVSAVDSEIVVKMGIPYRSRGRAV
jgi:hypothetical protein